jgi:hypothetical protein
VTFQDSKDRSGSWKWIKPVCYWGTSWHYELFLSSSFDRVILTICKHLIVNILLPWAFGWTTEEYFSLPLRFKEFHFSPPSYENNGRGSFAETISPSHQSDCSPPTSSHEKKIWNYNFVVPFVFRT